MKVLTVTDTEKTSRYALDVVRAVHVTPLDGLEGDLAHLNGKWCITVELKPIKSLDAEGKGQVVDVCQFKEWYFDSREEAETALVVDAV